jgi:hypothetical protein
MREDEGGRGRMREDEGGSGKEEGAWRRATRTYPIRAPTPTEENKGMMR